MAHTTKLSNYELKRGDPAIDADTNDDTTLRGKAIVTPPTPVVAVSTTAIGKDSTNVDIT